MLPPDGRCPACRARLGPPALTVEVTAAVVAGALAARIHPVLVLAAMCWLAACAIPLAYVDAAVRRLPDLLTVPAYAGTAVFLLAAAADDDPGPGWAAGCSAAPDTRRSASSCSCSARPAWVPATSSWPPAWAPPWLG